MSTAAADEPGAGVPERAVKPPFPWGPAASVVAAWTAMGMSTAIALAEVLLGRDGASFIDSNNIELRKRKLVIAAVLVSALVPAVVGLVKLVRGRDGAVTEMRKTAAFGAPLLVAWAIPPLFRLGMPAEKPLGYLLLLAGVVLALERLLRISFENLPMGWPALGERINRRVSSPAKRVVPMVAVATLASAYAAYMAYFTILEHHRFQTGGYDLGIYTSLIRNLAAGHFYRSPVLHPDASYLSHHAEFGSAYLVPIYALFPRAETLLTLQALTLGFAAVPLYLFAATQLPRGLAAAFAVAYLLFAPLHGANFYDFHWMPMTLPLWFTLLYGIAKRDYRIIVPAVLFVLPMREEAGLMLGAVGLLLVTGNHLPKLGLAFGVVGVSWFGLMRFVVIPSYGDAGFAGIYKSLVPSGQSGFGAVIATLLSNPSYVWTTLAIEAKLKFVLHMLGPLALLPVRRPALITLLIPGSLFTLLTTDYEPTVSISFQYTTHWVPWLFVASVLTVRRFALMDAPVARQRAATLAACFGVLCHSYVYGAVLQRETFVGGFHHISFGMSADDKTRYADFQKIVAEIPKGASVAATDSQSPHLGHLVDVCTLRITHGDADYLLISKRQFTTEDRRSAERALERAPFGVVDVVGDFYLFKRGHESLHTETALKELRLPGS